MIRVLHGEDEYSRSEALDRIRVSIGSPEIRESNITIFEGRSIQLADVVGACQIYPFMADRRVVLVYGVLERMQNRDKSLGDEWKDLSQEISSLPATAELVFIERITLRANAVALRSVGPSANVQIFKKKERGELEAWIRDRFAHYDSVASRESVARIGSLVGSDIRLLDQEIKKLALYAGDREVTQSDIDLMVPDSRDANIFEAIDAVFAHRPAVALRLLYILLSGGETIQGVLRMLSRQVRLLILTIELRAQSMTEEEIGKRIGLRNSWALDKTIRQSSNFDLQQLANIHRRLLAADLAIKKGEIDDRLAVEILVAELSAA
ncbi:MAG: DNA polymerase III subunit delta [SAR202 cluster bacterium]|nr:DNA polymerase III subunit delta [SAR202 cluster bacterium]|tara:strand:- start:16945 stop:17913 length:969 start_codon:yes stop_codon:yes gene_type:complete